MLLLKEASITGSQSVWRFGHCVGLGVVDKLDDRFSLAEAVYPEIG